MQEHSMLLQRRGCLMDVQTEGVGMVRDEEKKKRAENSKSPKKYENQEYG